MMNIIGKLAVVLLCCGALNAVPAAAQVAVVEADAEAQAQAEAQDDAQNDAQNDAQDDAQDEAEAQGVAGPVAGRAPGVPDPAPEHPELAGVFDDFGGMPGMTALMDDFMAIMLDDPRLRPFFENTEQDRIKRQLSEQFCAILGGGCAYSGRDMKESHAGFDIRRADFNALIEDLQIAMDRKRIPFRSQNKLLAILAPMHREVISR